MRKRLRNALFLWWIGGIVVAVVAFASGFDVAVNVLERITDGVKYFFFYWYFALVWNEETWET